MKRSKTKIVFVTRWENMISCIGKFTEYELKKNSIKVSEVDKNDIKRNVTEKT